MLRHHPLHRNLCHRRGHRAALRWLRTASPLDTRSGLAGTRSALVLWWTDVYSDIVRLEEVACAVQSEFDAEGGHVRPGVYTFVEDVVAVNGGAGRPYREALDARYNASKSFRILMIELSWFWSIGALVVGSVLTVLVCVHAVHKDVAYGIGESEHDTLCLCETIVTDSSLGWAVPFIWAGIWTLITIPWVQRALDKEEAEWGEIHHGVPSGILPEV